MACPYDAHIHVTVFKGHDNHGGQVFASPVMGEGTDPMRNSFSIIMKSAFGTTEIRTQLYPNALILSMLNS